jgi:cell division transport system permease protein
MKRMALRLSTFMILTASFSVISGVLLVGENLQRVLTLWGESMQMTVYLSENISSEATQQIETTLKENENLDKVQFVSNEKALSQFREQMASYAPDLLSDNEVLKSIPASFQFSLSSRVSPEDQLPTMQEVATRLKTQPGIDEVSYGQDWVKNYAQIVGAVRWTGAIFAFVIISSAIFVISNCIRSAVHQRREEIEVLELIGATSRYIRKPFLLEGLLLCSGSAFMGILIALGLYSASMTAMKSQISFLQLSQQIQFLRPQSILALILGSLAVGWMATVVCLRSLNDGWAASQRNRNREQ